MAERVMIGRTESGTTQGGKPIANLYSTDTRLRHPVLRLFDLSALATVGIDPNLPEPSYTRYWAHYQESEKKNAAGNPYKDVLYLERLDTPATSTSADNSALLDELRAIRAELIDINQKLDALSTGPMPPAAKPPADLSLPGDELPEPPQPKPEPRDDLTPHEARQTFYALASPAIASGKIDADTINRLIRANANGDGFSQALAELERMLQ